jgi:iron complex transport system substrate-binding protein
MAADYEEMTRGARNRSLVVLLAMCVLVLLASSEPRAGGPEAPRLVSLVPAVTEMLFAIGAGDDVVGVSSYDRFPPAALTKPKVGALVDPDFERILSLRPTLVVVYATQIDLIGRLERAHISTFRYELAGLADVTATIRMLGDRLGRAAKAREIAEGIERDLAAVRRSVAGQPRPRTVLIFGREAGTLRGIYASGGIGFMHDMLEAAGGNDIFSDIKRQNLQATTEMLLARAPDVIIEAYSSEGWPPERVAREREVWRALPSLPAVRSGRVRVLADDRLSIPGPRVAEGVKLLAAVLHGASK